MQNTTDFNNWNINFKNNNELKEILVNEFIKLHQEDRGLKLLNTNVQEYSLIEKFIYDIAMFHFKRLKIDFNKKYHHIEFWTNDRDCHPDSLHLDCDEVACRNEIKSTPILSTITYFSDIHNPTIITNITEQNVITNYYDNIDLFVSFPKFLKHISFNGGNLYHGSVLMFNNKDLVNARNVLAVSLWNKPVMLNFYTNINYKKLFDKNENVFIIDKDENINEIILDSKIQININDIVANRIENNKLFIKEVFFDRTLFIKKFIDKINLEGLLLYDIPNTYHIRSCNTKNNIII